MTIQLNPEGERLIQERPRLGAFHSLAEVIHRALVWSPIPKTPTVKKPRKNLVDVLSQPPFAPRAG
jgi:hypothetical protein